MSTKKVIAIDAETDEFLHGRIPLPFIWDAYDGRSHFTTRDTKEFIAWLRSQNCYAYAHNGGKFDFLYFLEFVGLVRCKIINGRIAEMPFGKARLRDSWSILPVSLDKIQKGNIDYSLMNKAVREKYMQSHIIPYLHSDTENLYEAVTKFRKMAGGRLTIASNAAANARKLGCGLSRTNYKFDRKFRPFYYGGRTECFKGGEHKNVTVIDIVSSYPKAMLHNHPTGSTYISYDPEKITQLSEREIQKSFIELDCYSAGAFPTRDKKGALVFPHEYGRHFITGWEYLVAKRHGIIGDEKIHRLLTFELSANFKAYVAKWFEEKKRHNKDTHPAEYLVAKTLLTSLYGKAAQNPLEYHDYKIVGAGTPVDFNNGWTLFSEYGDKEIHRRDALYSVRKKHGVEWEKRPVFYNVATGASITGFARAYLLDAICKVGRENVLYCDTDSLVLKQCDMSELPFGSDLGQWEIEGTAKTAYIAGKKLYGMKLTTANGKTKDKIASKGAKLTVVDMRELCKGKMIEWKNDAPSFSITRGALPLGENLQAPIDIEKFFIKREITATVQLPDYLAENERVKNVQHREQKARSKAYQRQRLRKGGKVARTESKREARKFRETPEYTHE